MARLSRRGLAIAILVAAAAFAGPSAALADCAEPPPVDIAVRDGENVFVGTVTALTAQDRWAKVQVEEIWKGQDTGPIVEVRGGESPGAVSTIDRFFRLGQRYVFVVGFGDTVFNDNGCSSTREWRDEYLEVRPAGWFGPRGADGSSAPTEPASLDLGFLVPLGAVAFFAIALVGGASFISRRRDT